MGDEKQLFARFLEITIYLAMEIVRWGRGWGLEIDRSCHCGLFGLCILLKTSIVFLETRCDVVFLIGSFFFVKIDGKSHPFEALMVNLASWTPSNFGRYPECPK